MKLLLRYLLVGIFCISTFSAKASYGYTDYTIGDFIYRLGYNYVAGSYQYDDHVFIVSAAPEVKLKDEVVIPSSVEILNEPRRVNGFLDYAFSGQDEMISITFPKYDGEDAVWFGKSSYGSGVFINCSSLERIEIPAAVRYISDWFTGCTSLEEVSLLGLDKTSNTDLSSLNITYDTFADCPVKIFSFNQNIEIANYEEGRCILPNIKSENITLGEKVTFIPSGLFTGRSDLVSFTVPVNITEIRKDAFKDCVNLTELNLGKVKVIENNAFNNCPLSEVLTIPGSVITLNKCFQNCSDVRRLVMEKYEGSMYGNIKNDGYIFTGTPIESAYIDREFETSNSQISTFPFLKSLELGSSVTKLPSRLFVQSPIEEIIFGEGIRIFEEYSVPLCLTKLVIPAQVEKIEKNAVSSLNDLEELIFEDGDNPINISYRKPSTTAYPMFENTSKLRKIYIGRNIVYERYVSASNPDLVSSQQLYSPFRDLGHPVWVMVGPRVTHMDPDMFYDKKYTALTSVDRIAMPEGIQLNGGYPYMKCVYPRDAVIQNGIIYDSQYTKLCWVDIDYEGEIKLPVTLREIGGVAMRNCRKASIDCIPANLEKIGDYAFDFSGVDLESIIFPESMREIGVGAFASCNIGSVTINEGLEKIGQGSLTRPSNVIYNARNAELIRNGNDKTAVFHPQSILFGEEVEVIPAFLMYNADVKKVSFPESLKEIGEYAFGSAYLTDLSIPGNVQTIGAGAFEECSLLKTITIEKGPSSLKVDKGPVFGKKVKPLRVSVGRDVVDQNGNPIQVYSNAPTTLYVGPDVKNLYRYNNLQPYKAIWNTSSLPAGAANYNLGRVANYTRADNLLPNAPGRETLKYLSSMFDQGGIYYVLTSPTEALAIDCSYSEEDKDISIPGQIESPRGEVRVSGMLPYTFTGNSSLEGVTFGFDGEIGQNAFQGCSSLKRFNSTGEITSVGTSAFNNCNSLENVKFSGSVATLGASSFANLPKLVSVHFTMLNEIGADAFNGDSSLQQIDLPESVTSIGNNAFYNCSALESISLPASLEKIGSHVFYGCSSLREIDLESNIPTLAEHVFNGCTALEEISLPRHIKEIKTSAFTGCTALKSLTIHSRTAPLQFNSYDKTRAVFTDSPIERLHLDGDVTYPSGCSPFSNLTSLNTVTMGHNVSSLPNDIFSGCHNLENIDLSEGIEIIGDRAFQDCMNLRELKLGPSVVQIGAYAFNGANSLEKLISEAQNPPVCGTDALDGIDKFTCELHVPTPALEKYKHAPQWEDFFTIKGTDIATNVEEAEILSKNIICMNGGLRIIGLNGKMITVSSLDGQIVINREITVADQFISLPQGIWVITAQNFSKIVLIK